MKKSELGQDDPLDFWLKEASYHLGKTGISSCSPAKALSIVVNTFGRDWLLQEIKNAKGQHAIDVRHPLVSLITIAGIRQVCGVLELANYISELYLIPRFDQVIAMMKVKRQYSTAFNQLAFAYRFHKTGVSDLEFEPPTDGGKNSDIMFNYKGVVYIVESFVPESAKGISYDNVLKLTTKKVEELITETGKRISTFVSIKDIETWDDSKRKPLEADVVKLIRDVRDGDLIVERDHYTVTVIDTSNMDDGEELSLSEDLFSRSVAGMNFALMKKDDQIKVMRGEKVETTLVGRFYLDAVSGKQPTTEELVSKLADKVEKKIKQTKKEELKAKGILLVGQPFLGSEENKKKINFQRVKGKVIDKHATVQAVLMVKYTSGPDSLPFFTGVFLDKNDSGECEGLLNELIKQEWDKDFLMK